jgi:hypothetical protein
MRTATKKSGVTRVVLAQLDLDGPPMFWGLLTLPDGVALEDIPPLYRQWRKLCDSGACKTDFPDWLLSEHGFGEEPAGFCWLDPDEDDGDEEDEE